MPLQRSISAILKMIAHTQDADAASIYEYRSDEAVLDVWGPTSGAQHRRPPLALSGDMVAWLESVEQSTVIAAHPGQRPSVSALLHGFATCIVTPVAVQKHRKLFLYVAWKQFNPDPDLACVAGLAEGLKLILARLAQEDHVRGLMGEVTRLQLELADWKIAERTTGMIGAGVATSTAADVVYQHIARVLESSEEVSILENRIEQLNAELASRHRIAIAKAILQEKHGISEQEAYLRLQRASRRARISIGQLAERVVEARDREFVSRRIA